MIAISSYHIWGQLSYIVEAGTEGFLSKADNKNVWSLIPESFYCDFCPRKGYMLSRESDQLQKLKAVKIESFCSISRSRFTQKKCCATAILSVG